ncbi:MAG: fumarylacetoacetate hydrolase family protein [Chloroflexi bacterium]|nr:fumarylacetoacetate hydrolase family protein [Chloroflexota bacterium]MBV9601416.1 fumarylacetoacetate hydrolase family protein [Chloroflexota bacterium]
MKLLTFDPGSGPRAGVLVDSEVVDATTLLGAPATLRDVRAILESSPDALDRLREALPRVQAPRVALDEVRLRAPILQPPTIRDHIAFEEHATGQWTRDSSGPRMEAWTRLPIFYFSCPLRIFGSDELVPYPAATRQLDYECELAAIVGREGTNVLEAHADSYIAGFTIFNDWSCRDLQFDESQFGLGPAKGKDSASSLGPWVVTLDEMAPFYRNGTLHVQCRVRVNGVVWMEGNAWNMHHTFGAMLERAAQDSRVVPGDVIASGTVGGGSISEAVRKGYPARWLQPGDVVEMEVEGIGTLRSTLGPSTNPNQHLRFLAPRQGSLPDPMSAADLQRVRERTAPR